MYGWVERQRPLVYVFTDGGGRSGQSRLTKTAELLERVGARHGVVFGRMPDLAVYDAILRRDVALFSALVEELTADLIANDIDCVVGDAAEGYNSVHDVWRLMINAAVARALDRGHEIENCEFSLVAPQDETSDAPESHEVTLDDDEFRRKLDAARAYSPKLAADVDAAMAGGKFFGIRRFSEPQIAGDADEEMSVALSKRFAADDRSDDTFSSMLQGIDINALRHERFWRHDLSAPLYSVTPPFYEVYGEELVRLGRYEHAIRYEEHVRPIADALRAQDNPAPCA